jgi:membrane-associated phospholipid phosphatase
VGGIRVGPGRPLLADGARPWAGAVLACCAVLVAALGAVFAHQSRADPFDRAVDGWFISTLGGHWPLLLWLATPGTLLPAALLSAAIVAGCLLARRLNGAILAAAAVPVSVELDEGVFKPLFHRTYLGGVVYPSGHTTAVIALAATLTVLLLASPRSAGARAAWVLPALAFVLAAVVAVAVIGLRWHYFTDTVAGAGVGIGTVCGLALVLDLPAVRRWLTWDRQRPGGAARASSPSTDATV